jgi:DNA polymerase
MGGEDINTSTGKSNEKVEKAERVDWKNLFTRGVTDGDAPRHTDPLSVDSVRGINGHAVRWPLSTAVHQPVSLDFETRNIGGCKLKEAGAWRYAADHATEILSLVYHQNGDGESRLWTPATGTHGLAALAADPAVTFTCFGDFELAVWNRIMVARHGLPPIPISRWDNAQATCSYLALPRALDKTLTVIGSEVVKDAAGRRLVLSLSRSHRKTGAYPEATPELLERVFAYNRVDVAGLAAIRTAVGTLPERERRVWELDQTINQRGVGIDLDFVRAAKHIAEASKGALLEEFAGLTKDPEWIDDPGISPYQVAKTREWLKGRNFTFANLGAETVEDALENLVLPDDVKRVLQIRLITAPTSLQKLDAMLNCVGGDGRARGLFQYHGATPGRWSATLIQPQNLPRPTVDIDPNDIEELVAAVKTGDPEALKRWGEPIDVLTSSLRFALTAADGAQFGAGDFSMIETCVLLALAGQRDKCRLIEQGVDIYKDMAATIYQLDREAFQAIPRDALTIDQRQQRQVGKNTILGCGYQMGPDRFRRQYCRHMEAEEAKRFAEETVYTHYRRNWAPRVPKLWRDLERTARRAMLRRGVAATAECGISYRLETVAGLPCLVCRLLNGKCIHYMNARVLPDRLDHWGCPTWSYWAYRKGQWREIQPYGGQLTENVVQALARELLVDAMFRFEAHGFPVTAHCHDEITVEHPEITEAAVKEIMAERPQWAAELGVPITVEAWAGKRYRK